MRVCQVPPHPRNQFSKADRRGTQDFLFLCECEQGRVAKWHKAHKLFHALVISIGVLGAIRQSRTDAGVTYDMSYKEPPSRPGKYHKVRVTCLQPGSKVLSQQGFYSARLSRE